MKFPTEDLVELAYTGEGQGFDGYKVVRNTLDSTSRWTVTYQLIFEKYGRFWRTYFDRGATEYQDYGPFEDEGDEAECVEVFPYTRSITEYREAVTS